MQKLLSFPIHQHRFHNNTSLLEMKKQFERNCTPQLKEILMVNENEKLSVLIQTMLQKNPELMELSDYQIRMADELTILLAHKKDINLDLLLIYEDIAHFYEKKNVLSNVGRGSSASSLILFLLGITKVDPIKYGLRFERLLYAKEQAIDIDIDVCNRKELISYLQSKYGMFFKNVEVEIYWRINSSILEVLKHLNYAQRNTFTQIVDEMSVLRRLKTFTGQFDDDHVFFEFICEQNSLFNKFFALNPHYKTQITSLLNSKKRNDKHAAAYVISDTNRLLMKEVEEDGVVKIDILGLNVYEEIKDKISLRKFQEIDFQKIDIPSIIHNANAENKDNRIIKFLKKHPEFPAETIIDLAMIEAIDRPYPLCLINNLKLESKNHIIQNILKDTRGVVIFQEDILRIFQEVFNMTKYDSLMALKVVANDDDKSLIFFNKLIKENPDLENEIIKIKQICPLSFNKSHAISYTMLNLLKLM